MTQNGKLAAWLHHFWTAAMTERCAEADRLYGCYVYAVGSALKDYYWGEYCHHKRTCPKCKQRMSEMTQAARVAEMPEMDDD